MFSNINIKKLLSNESSLVNLYIDKDYFLFKKSLTNSGAITDSTNMYAPVFGDFTIFIAFVKRFDPVCKDATDFFAMVSYFISL